MSILLKEPNKDLLTKVKQKAEAWKKHQKQAKVKTLNALDEKQLQELAKYPEWLKIALENSHYFNDVFKWSLCDFNSVEVIVKCFETKEENKICAHIQQFGIR